MEVPRILDVQSLQVGLRAEFEREITEHDVSAFATLSQDYNPLHVDESYAHQTNYGNCIVHGAFQVGLASAMAGMYLPGRDVVVSSFTCRFPAPLYYPSRVKVQGEITSWVRQTIGGVLRVRVVDTQSLKLTAEIHVGFSLHDHRSSSQGMVEKREQTASAKDSRPLILVTGATGGLGRHIASVLSRTYQVLGIGRSIPSEVNGHVEWAAVDLSSNYWESLLEPYLRGRPIYGIVHAAWPTGPIGSLLDVEEDAIRMQLDFGGIGVVRIARFLRSQVDGAGRIVILGTTFATLKPAIHLSAYSLGKAALEHTVRLLAPELARSNITINLVAPSFVAAGMNSTATNRTLLTETAKVPLGKLCNEEDVASSIEFFLSPGAGFITGQLLPLTGGQL